MSMVNIVAELMMMALPYLWENAGNLLIFITHAPLLWVLLVLSFLIKQQLTRNLITVHKMAIIALLVALHAVVSVVPVPKLYMLVVMTACCMLLMLLQGLKNGHLYLLVSCQIYKL